MCFLVISHHGKVRFLQELQVGTCEVYDHGVFCFEELELKFGLKELLPARLHGRQIMVLQTGNSGALKLHRGYHDAPSINESMCICFCKLHMPKVKLIAACSNQLKCRCNRGCTDDVFLA